MIKELWNSFPHLLEEKINALLDEAEPTNERAFQLYKTCQREEAWNGTFEKFSEHLNAFFSINKLERRKSHFDTYLDKPLSHYGFEGFDLDFRSGEVNAASVMNLTSWAHHLMRVGHKTESIVISEDVLGRTLQNITHPGFYEKTKDIRFEDFLIAWKSVVFKLFGKKHDPEFNKILTELRWMYSEYADTEKDARPAFIPTIYLTQTEIDWTNSVRFATENNFEIPKFPLSRGPQKQRLIDLERTISLYRIVQNSQHTDFLKHRENIRTTILHHCESLLKECAR
jgi:hypothetical protein